MTTALLLAVIIIIAVVLWLVPGIDPTLRKLLIAVAVVAFIAWLLYILGLFDGFRGERIRVNTGRDVPAVRWAS